MLMKVNMTDKFIALVLFVFMAAGCETAPGAGKKADDDLPYKNADFTPDCRWGATPDNVMDVMFEMAALKQDDVLFDLGCGDGRVVVEAVKRYGLAGVGIEIDPDKIIASRKRARAAGVERRTYFANRDLFETDFSRATVLALFITTDMLVKLRPRLLEQLKPGTRIVLHTHSMGAWEPDRARKIDIACFDPKKTGCFRVVKLFIVPANFTGTWSWQGDGESMRLELKQKFQTVTGTLSRGGKTIEIDRIRLRGNEIRFTAIERGGGVPVNRNYAGTIRGNTIEGAIAIGRDTAAPSQPWRANRAPGTMEPIAR